MRPETLIIGFSTASVIFVFQYTYFLILWVAKKLPVVNIK